MTKLQTRKLCRRCVSYCKSICGRCFFVGCTGLQSLWQLVLSTWQHPHCQGRQSCFEKCVCAPLVVHINSSEAEWKHCPTIGGHAQTERSHPLPLSLHHEGLSQQNQSHTISPSHSLHMAEDLCAIKPTKSLGHKPISVDGHIAIHDFAELSIFIKCIKCTLDLHQFQTQKKCLGHHT